MAGETDVKAEPVQDPTAATPAPAPEPDPAPGRPIVPEVLAVLERGRMIHERMGAIRTDVIELVDALIARFPGYKKQIADVLDGQAQRLLKLHHDEQQESRRNGSR